MINVFFNQIKIFSQLKMALRFCPNLSFMFQEGATLLDRYDLAKEAGFRAVECAFPYEHTAEELAEAKTKAGLQHVLINAYAGDWNEGYRGLAAIPGKEEDFRTSIKKAIEYALKLDCKIVHVMAGVVEEETEEHTKVYMDNLHVATELLGKRDMTVVIEPINKFSIPNYFLNNYDKAMSIIKHINKPNLKLQLDIFHMQQICGNLTRNIEQLLPYVGHIQIGQVPNRNGPFTPGEVNYDYVFHLLRKHHYDGWIGLEYTPITKTKDALKWVCDM